MARPKVVKMASFASTPDVWLEAMEDEDGNFFVRIHGTTLGYDDTDHMTWDIDSEDLEAIAGEIGDLFNFVREKQILKGINGEPFEPIIIRLTKQWTAKYPAFTLAIWRVTEDTLKLRVDSRDDDYYRHVFIEDHIAGHAHADKVALPNMTGKYYLEWQYQNQVDES